MALAPLSAGFQSLPPLPTIKLGPSNAASQVGGLEHVLGPCGSLQWTLLWGLEFLLLLPQSPQVFSISSLWLYFPTLGLWVARSVTQSTSCCLAGQLQLCPPCSTVCHLAGSSSCHLATSPLPAGCPSLPLLPVWMNVSSLSPWSLDFHTVRFSVSSGCFFVFKLLSFFWLCEEAQCVYLCPHLGQKSTMFLHLMKLSQHLSLTDRKHAIQNNGPQFIDEERMNQKRLIYLSHSESKSKVTFLRAHSVLKY